MEKLYLKTVSRNLLEGKNNRYESISLFSFENGTRKINFAEKNKDMVLTQGTTWIRVHIKGEMSYDFVVGSLTAFYLDNALIIIANDDAEFIDVAYVSKLVRDFSIKQKMVERNTEEEELDAYYKSIIDETNKLSKELSGLYMISKQVSSSRLNIQDSYEYGKQQLEKINMLNILIRQVVKENREQILNLI